MAVGTGSLEQKDAKKIVDRWQREARGQERVRRVDDVDMKRAMLAAMGIKAPPSRPVESL